MPSVHEVPQLMPQVRQSLEVHGVIHEVLPCPDELSDTALTVQLTGMQIGGVTPSASRGCPFMWTTPSSSKTTSSWVAGTAPAKSGSCPQN